MAIEAPPTDKMLDEYLSLRDQKESLEAQLKPVNARLDELGDAICADWRANGTSKITRDGRTVYLARDVSVSSVEGTEATVDALRRARLGELIGVNHMRLKAWVKEKCFNKLTDTWEVNAEKLPPSLRDLIKLEEFWSVRCRKA